MRDRPLIGAGLLLFLGVITLPFWYGRMAGMTPNGPDPKLPRDERQCVAPTAFMRASHMDLLVQWREQAVRAGATTYVAGDGRRYSLSLSKTCLTCHKNKADFCDRCHTYAAVSLSCWDCHVDPAALGRTALVARRVAAVSGGGER
jgi:hypothetical protein